MIEHITVKGKLFEMWQLSSRNEGHLWGENIFSLYRQTDSGTRDGGFVGWNILKKKRKYQLTPNLWHIIWIFQINKFILSQNTTVGLRSWLVPLLLQIPTEICSASKPSSQMSWRRMMIWVWGGRDGSSQYCPPGPGLVLGKNNSSMESLRKY